MLTEARCSGCCEELRKTNTRLVAELHKHQPPEPPAEYLHLLPGSSLSGADGQDPMETNLGFAAEPRIAKPPEHLGSSVRALT